MPITATEPGISCKFIFPESHRRPHRFSAQFGSAKVHSLTHQDKALGCTSMSGRSAHSAKRPFCVVCIVSTCLWKCTAPQDLAGEREVRSGPSADAQRPGRGCSWRRRCSWRCAHLPMTSPRPQSPLPPAPQCLIPPCLPPSAPACAHHSSTQSSLVQGK